VQSTGYCAFHTYVATSNSSIYLPVVNLPYQTDAGAGCGENFVNAGSKGTDDGFSIDAGHETMETISDPLDNAWIDPNDDTSGGEVADKCAWAGEPFGLTDPVGNVALATGTFAVQSLWSNSAKGCSMDPVSVSTPAAQSGTLGKAVSLAVKATVNSSTPLTYTASGLPAGLSVSKTTGVVSGTPGVTAGTFTPKVTVAYNDGSRWVSFSWKVSSAAGQLKGYDAKCLGDYNAKTTAGNKIVIWTCAAGAAQNITFATNTELLVVGDCVTGTTTAFLEPCTGATSQEWTRQSNGEYVLKSNGKCLSDPANSRRDGTQLRLLTCKDTINQRWSLP
jgi:serine protease